MENAIMENGKLELNEDSKRFELKVDGTTVFIDYKLRNDVMYLIHTEVPKEHEGKGLGSKIVNMALNYIKEHNYKVAPLCSFVAAYVVKHPEWKPILVPGA